MLIIGITGSFGSGKTSVAHFFKKRGSVIINADRIAHHLLEPGQKCYDAVLQRFGKSILKNGRIQRQKLADIVFQNPEAREYLNTILHPAVIAHIKNRIKEFRRTKTIRAVILDVPLLIEANMDHLCDVIVVVKANIALQTKRIKQRSGLTSQEVRQRIKAQMPLQRKLPYADFVIDNRGSLRKTQRQVEQIRDEIFQRTSTRRI